jgi:RND family efflux transporter MFP subunit
MKKSSVALVIAAIAGAAFLYEGGYKLFIKPEAAKPKHDASHAAQPQAVSVVRVAQSDFIETVLVTGTLVPRDELLIAPEVEGLRVAELKVEEGEHVRAGQVLAVLTQATLDAQLSQNDASLARSSAAIAQASSQIAQAEAKVKEAKAAFDRARPLNDKGYLADATLDTREAAARTAEAQLVAARDGLKVAEADRTVLEAQRRELAWKRSRTEIKAPADGVVSRRNARVGAIATAIGEPLLRVVARGEIELEGEITEESLAKVREGQPVRVEATGLEPLEGKVRIVPAEIDKATRLGKLRIFIGDKPGLKVGGFARGLIETARSKGLGVPPSAILYGRDGSSVQLVKDGRIETRRIATGLRSGNLVEVRSGLSDGDTIVEKSGTFLRDGDAVRPMQEAGGGTVSGLRSPAGGTQEATR